MYGYIWYYASESDLDAKIAKMPVSNLPPNYAARQIRSFDIVHVHTYHAQASDIFVSIFFSFSLFRSFSDATGNYHLSSLSCPSLHSLCIDSGLLRGKYVCISVHTILVGTVSVCTIRDFGNQRPNNGSIRVDRSECIWGGRHRPLPVRPWCVPTDKICWYNSSLQQEHSWRVGRTIHIVWYIHRIKMPILCNRELGRPDPQSVT